VDTFSWNDLTESWQKILLNRNIADQGQLRKLKEFCDSYVYEQQVLFCESSFSGKLLVDLINYNEIPVMFRQTIPFVNHYIKRKLRTRYYISATIFETNCEKEVCVFTGFESVEKWEEVSKYCKGTVDTSGNQLSQEKLTANFIVVSMSGHFEKIVSKAHSDQSIHLISYQNERLIWIYTVGKLMDLVQMNLCGESFQKEIPEEDIFLEIKHRKELLEQFKPQVEQTTIILVDSPGMGKSVLLANLAEKTRKYYADRKDAFVFYFVMTDFIAAITQRQNQKGFFFTF